MQTTKFGTVLGLAPGDVPVYSSDYATADSNEFPNRKAYRSFVDGIFMGYKWQCVEFVRRWLCSRARPSSLGMKAMAWPATDSTTPAPITVRHHTNGNLSIDFLAQTPQPSEHTRPHALEHRYEPTSLNASTASERTPLSMQTYASRVHFASDVKREK